MENLNAENIINEIQSLIKALKDCGGWVKRGNGEGWFNHEILADALALITSQEQRVKELETENRQYYYEQRKLVEARDTYKEYAENMQLFVEKIVHLEDKGYEPSAARYAAEMDMWRAVALEKKRLTEENERLRNRITCQVVLPDEKLEEIKNECLERVELDIKKIEADTVRKMQERVRTMFLSKNTYYAEQVFSYIDQIAKEMLEGEK